MKTLFTFVTAVLIACTASASDFAALLGFRSNSADLAVGTGDVSSKTGIGAGVLGFFDLADKLQGRVGFIYNQRNVAYGTPEYDYNAAYMDIPITAMYKFADYAGAFAGPVIAMLASKECKAPGGCATSPEGMSIGMQFGASFKFAPQLGAELYYEMIPSTYWKDSFKNMRTVGVNLLFTFE